MEAASEGDNVGGAAEGGVGVVRVQPSCRQASMQAGNVQPLCCCHRGCAKGVPPRPTTTLSLPILDTSWMLPCMPWISCCHYALTLDLCVLAGKLDAGLVSLCAGVGKEGAVSKAGLHQTLGQLDLQRGRWKEGQGERAVDPAASAASAAPAATAAGRREAGTWPGQRCRQAGRQAGVFQGAHECPPTWGAVWNRLLTCDSMLACSVTASTHRGSPWPAHRSSSRGARQRGEGRG